MPLCCVVYMGANMALIFRLVNQGPSFNWSISWGVLTLFFLSLTHFLPVTQNGARYPKWLRFFKLLAFTGWTTWFLGTAMIGFDNLGVGRFILYFLALGILSSLAALAISLEH